jgi:hypothetical protein
MQFMCKKVHFFVAAIEKKSCEAPFAYMLQNSILVDQLYMKH